VTIYPVTGTIATTLYIWLPEV